MATAAPGFWPWDAFAVAGTFLTLLMLYLGLHPDVLRYLAAGLGDKPVTFDRDTLGQLFRYCTLQGVIATQLTLFDKEVDIAQRFDPLLLLCQQRV